jgi:hypothetical protein
MYESIITQSNLFEENKYARVYFSLIDNAKKQKRSKNDCVYYEKHHILPKCLFSEYANLNTYNWNGVFLTGREHFVAHKLLTKFVNKQTVEYHKILSALGSMIRKKERNLSSRQYEECKIALAESLSFKRKGKTYEEIHGKELAFELRSKRSETQSRINTGRRHSEESIKKNSETNIAHRNNMSEEEKKHVANKISISNKGKRKPVGFSQKISSAQKGRQKSEQERAKLGAASKGTCFINKDGINTKIKIHLLEEYTNLGWNKGMLNKKKGLKHEVNN